MSDVEDNDIVSVSKAPVPVSNDKKAAAKKAKRPAGKIDYPRTIAGKAIVDYQPLYKKTGVAAATSEQICEDGFGVSDVLLHPLFDPREHVNVWRDEKGDIRWSTTTRRNFRMGGNKDAPTKTPEGACKGKDEREYDPRAMLYNPMIHAFFAGSKLTKEDFEGDEEIMVLGCMPLASGMREILAETGPIYELSGDAKRAIARMSASAGVGGDDEDDDDGDDDDDDKDDAPKPAAKAKPAAKTKPRARPAAAASKNKRPADAEDGDGDDEPIVPVKPASRKKVAQKPASANDANADADTEDEDKASKPVAKPAAANKKAPKRKQEAEDDADVAGGVEKAEIPMPSVQVKPVARKKTAAATPADSFSAGGEYSKAVVQSLTRGKGPEAEYNAAELAAIVACKQLTKSPRTPELLELTCGTLGDNTIFSDAAGRAALNDVPDETEQAIQRLIKAPDSHHTISEIAFLMAINAARTAFESTLPHVADLTTTLSEVVAQNKRLEARIAELERGQGGSNQNLEDRVKELEMEVRAKNVDLAALRLVASGKSPAATGQNAASKKKINLNLDD